MIAIDTKLELYNNNILIYFFYRMIKRHFKFIQSWDMIPWVYVEILIFPSILGIPRILGWIQLKICSLRNICTYVICVDAVQSIWSVEGELPRISRQSGWGARNMWLLWKVTWKFGGTWASFAPATHHPPKMVGGPNRSYRVKVRGEILGNLDWTQILIWHRIQINFARD